MGDGVGFTGPLHAGLPPGPQACSPCCAWQRSCSTGGSMPTCGWQGADVGSLATGGSCLLVQSVSDSAVLPDVGHAFPLQCLEWTQRPVWVPHLMRGSQWLMLSHLSADATVDEGI